MDVADERSVQELISATVKRFGGLDIAVNNAGITGELVPQCDVPSEKWRRVIDVNLSSVFYCLKAELLKRGGGSIVNTSSITGMPGNICPRRPWLPHGKRLLRTLIAPQTSNGWATLTRTAASGKLPGVSSYVRLGGRASRHKHYIANGRLNP